MKTVFAGAFIALTSTVAIAQVAAPNASVGGAASWRHTRCRASGQKRKSGEVGRGGSYEWCG